MALAAVGDHKLAGFIPVGEIFYASNKIGRLVAGSRKKDPTPPTPPPSGSDRLVTLRPSKNADESLAEPASKL